MSIYISDWNNRKDAFQLAPTIADSRSFWQVGGQLLPADVKNRNRYYTDLHEWVEGRQDISDRLGTLESNFPTTRVNWFDTVSRNYSNLMMTAPPETDSELTRHLYPALYASLLNLFRYGTGIMVIALGMDDIVRPYAISPWWYWRDERDNQFYIIQHSSSIYTLGKWLRDEGLHEIRTCRTSNEQIETLEVPVAMPVSSEIPVVAILPRLPTLGDSDMGTSMLPVIAPLVAEASAINTRNSYIFARHGKPTLALFQEGESLQTNADGTDLDRSALNEAIQVQLADQVLEDDVVKFSAWEVKDAKYLTWNQGLTQAANQSLREIEQQIAAITGLPSTLLSAEGRVASGSALKRLYINAYAHISQVQSHVFPIIQEFIRQASVAMMQQFQVPDEWLNPFDVLDGFDARAADAAGMNSPEETQMGFVAEE